MNNPTSKIIVGDCLEVLRTLPDCSVQTCITSPPYWGLRDYGHDGQLGLERTPEEYVANMVAVFREVRRVLADDGTLWMNLGDSYAGTGKSGGGAQGARWDECGMDTEGPKGGKWMPPPAGLKQKDLVGIPWRVAFALQADGWWLRQDIIWAKHNPMPESVTDRCTRAHEYIFLMTKSALYFYDAEAIQEPATGEAPGNVGPSKPGRAYYAGDDKHRTAANLHKIEGRETRNRRSVWTVATQGFPGAHFATFPPALIEPCVLAGSREGDTVLDPFNGAGTTGLVALGRSRHYIGIEINPEYAAMAQKRIDEPAPLFRSTEVIAA